MKAGLQRVLELQREYQPRVSSAMDERGRLVRNATPAWLHSHEELLSEAMGVEDFFAEGRDGTGLKTRVPWVRLGSRSRSPRATEGFYIVYLFDFQGERVYLSLNQGTTDFVNGEFIAKDPGVLESRVQWAREVLVNWLPRVGAETSMTLNDPRLGMGYEAGNVMARAYAKNRIPDDGTLLSDLRLFAEGLGILYRANATQPLPHQLPEVREAEEAAAEASGHTRARSRAGFRTNAAEIKLVETHAVTLARAYYEGQGWAVKELGKPFDLKATKAGRTLDVEVKGTTSDGAGIPLTAGEVRHHERAFPDNALVIVRSIVLDRTTVPPVVSRGVLYELREWEIDQADLRAISYSYEVPATMYDGVGFPHDTLIETTD